MLRKRSNASPARSHSGPSPSPLLPSVLITISSGDFSLAESEPKVNGYASRSGGAKVAITMNFDSSGAGIFRVNRKTLTTTQAGVLDTSLKLILKTEKELLQNTDSHVEAQ